MLYESFPIYYLSLVIKPINFISTGIRNAVFASVDKGKKNILKTILTITTGSEKLKFT
jgi:hypothetical protein